jgi:hypothetical protein
LIRDQRLTAAAARRARVEVASREETVSPMALKKVA